MLLDNVVRAEAGRAEGLFRTCASSCARSCSRTSRSARTARRARPSRSAARPRRRRALAPACEPAPEPEPADEAAADGVTTLRLRRSLRARRGRACAEAAPAAEVPAAAPRGLTIKEIQDVVVKRVVAEALDNPEFAGGPRKLCRAR